MYRLTIGPLGGDKTTKSTMKTTTFGMTLWILIIFATLSLASAKPTELKRSKRQSDQRIAELETLLALQKYGQHRLADWGRGRNLAPGYGLIDFDKIGRRKKSTRFLPGEDEGKIWENSNWVFPLSSQQEHETSRSSSTLFDSQLDQK